MITALNDYAENLTALLDLDGEMAQFEYLIEVGRNAPEFNESERIIKNEMSGCLAKVWILQNKEDNRYYYSGDSNAAIVKGLVTIITEAMSGHTQKEIKEIKHQAVYNLGLGVGLTSRRQVGMMAMIDHIKKLSGAKPYPHEFNSKFEKRKNSMYNIGKR